MQPCALYPGSLEQNRNVKLTVVQTLELLAPGEESNLDATFCRSDVDVSSISRVLQGGSEECSDSSSLYRYNSTGRVIQAFARLPGWSGIPDLN